MPEQQREGTWWCCLLKVTKVSRRAAEIRKISRSLRSICRSRCCTQEVDGNNYCNSYRREMQNQFPDLRLCDSNRKIDQIAMDSYPSWHTYYFKNSRIKKEGEAGVEAVVPSKHPQENAAQASSLKSSACSKEVKVQCSRRFWDNWWRTYGSSRQRYQRTTEQRKGQGYELFIQGMFDDFQRSANIRLSDTRPIGWSHFLTRLHGGHENAGYLI